LTVFILGGGVTGLAAGMASGFTILEAAETAGGICGSYYLRPGEATRLPKPPPDGEAYRFERGGGHWIFGGDSVVLPLLNGFSPLTMHRRKATAYFPERNLHVDYPVQHHAEQLGSGEVQRIQAETTAPAREAGTLRDWLEASFGPALCRDFFFPFHELYTAGLYHRIAPQNGYKSPVASTSAGYNVDFGYPAAGLDSLIRGMAAQCRIQYASKVAAIDPRARRLQLADGRQFAYARLLSTLPLNRMIELTGISLEASADPWTSVLVLNIAARRGRNYPDVHWSYLPGSRAGFHRVGFYDNVEPTFLPRSGRAGNQLASLYVERAFVGGERPTGPECEAYAARVVAELQDWGFIGEVLLVDPTWIDVAYTWSWPGSSWKRQALAALAAFDIHQVGRYGRWNFQGIARSIRDGLSVVQSARERE
jgi:protoporphyrinogen oxidase